MKNERQHILIFRLGSLGDTIMALPCFHAIREKYPDAHITLLTNKPVSSKAARVQDVLGIPSYFLNEVLYYPAGMRNIWSIARLIFKIRAQKNSVLVNISASRGRAAAKRDHLFFKLCGIRTLIGFPRSHDHFAAAKDDVTGKYEWEAKRLANRITELGHIDLDNDRYWDLKLTADEIDEAENFKTQHGFDRVIAIAPGTKMQSKDWGKDNWKKLISDLSAQFSNWKLLILGSADENDMANDIAQGWTGQQWNMCGKIPVRVAYELLRDVKIFIGHDSGPMHLAAAAGAPCVAIFSARNLAGQWYPRGKDNIILYHETECAGCNLEVCIENARKCIASITVNEVYTAVVKKLMKNREFVHENT